MKTVVIGDVHGRSLWKLIVNQEQDADRIVFIGDYFDSFDIKGDDQLNNFLDIIEYKKSSSKEVIMLIGNHDHHYFPEVGNTGTSGYQVRMAPSIQHVIDTNREHLQMAYQMDEFLFSHAGISSMFLDSVFGKDGWKEETMVEQVNELFKYKPLTFGFGEAVNISEFSFIDPYGDNTEQSPIWIRPRSLMKANYNTLRKKVIQVVGHTQVKKLDLEGAKNSAGGRYYLIDCQGTTGEYLIIEDGNLNVGQTR
jgi:predicted MPP superfamily phosphohydrolase